MPQSLTYTSILLVNFVLDIFEKNGEKQMEIIARFKKLLPHSDIGVQDGVFLQRR